MKCPLCFEGILETKKGDYIEGKYTVENTEWEVCPNCGEKFFGPKIMEGLGRAFYVNNDLIFPEDIKRRRESCGKTQLELANELGVSPNSIKRWEKGSYIQPADKNRRIITILQDWENKSLSSITSDKWISKLMDKDYSAPLAFAGNTEGNVCKENEKDISEIIKKFK
ncbi:MAG: helix-turn-helix domain-containing protein [Candidatus Marinimicrobia bacterium]|nr:helix-turn-helix domain-containing protein [Candidatus Neomarinimicrobiota bacterium]